MTYFMYISAASKAAGLPVKQCATTPTSAWWRHPPVSVYADDVTLSSHKSISGELVWNIKSVLYSKGLGTKKGKEASMVHKAADITGVIVGKQGVSCLCADQRSAA